MNKNKNYKMDELTNKNLAVDIDGDGKSDLKINNYDNELYIFKIRNRNC